MKVSVRRLLQSFGHVLPKRFYSSGTDTEEILISIPEIKSFVERCMTKAGSRSTHATELAEVLVAADHRGHYSHGLNRLEMYVKDIQSGITVSDKEPEIVRQTAATAYVAGNNVLGPTVGNFCMKLAIKKAKSAGIGWVVAKGSNHYSIAGWYSMQAVKEGLLGMSFTNTSPLVLPTRARVPTLGTNPISVAAPGTNGDSYVLDMATSSVSVGKIELNNVKNIDIPSGWGADAKGKETHNPKEVLDGGGLLPLGGSEISSGYKGYGLGLLVEIFCGILGDADYANNIRLWKQTDRIANLGQCFVALDPDTFAPGFPERMQDLMNICRNLEKAEGEDDVLVPGDPEKIHMSKCDLEGGIRYHPNQVYNMNDLAEHLDVNKMKTKDNDLVIK